MGSNSSFLKMDDLTATAARSLEAIAWKYFAQEDSAKDSNSGRDRSNLGYIRVVGTREFIKLRPSDETQLWPSAEALPSFAETYGEFYARYVRKLIKFRYQLL